MSEQLLTLASLSLLAATGIAASIAPLAQARAAASDPFRVANLNPPVAVAGLPVWSAIPDVPTFGMTTEVANHYRLSGRGGDRLILDGETLRLRAYVEWPFADVWSVALDMPYIHQSGGVLDDLVDSWHSAFNQPDGARNLQPEGVLNYDFGNADGRFFQLTESGSGPGDLQVSVARRLGAGSGWTLRGTVKLPTGRERLLAGSGATDITLSVLRARAGLMRGRTGGYYFGFGLTEFSQPDNVRFPAEKRVLSSVLGGGIALAPRFGIRAQFDAHSALYRSPLEEIGQTSVLATLGGWFDVGRRLVLDFGVSEDLQVSTAPDVVLFVDVRWRPQ